MDAMSPFERQIARELRREIGPPPRFHAAAVVRDAQALSRGRRSRSWVVALRFVTAGVVIAVFGGSLIAGSLMHRLEQTPLPGAVPTSVPLRTAPPTTRPTEPHDGPVTDTRLLPGVNLTTEEVEPGVLRVVGDGVRDLSFRFGFPDAWPGLRTGLDGSVWLRDDELGLIRLGDPRVFEIDYDPFDAYSRGHDSAIALDGTIWTVTHDHALMAFDGEASRRYVAPDGGSFDQVVVTGDGTVWATWVRGKNKAVVGRLAGDAWQIVVAPFRRLPSVQRNVFSVSDDGQIWLGGRRLDEDGPDHGTAIDDAVGANGISPDGTLWARTGATSIARVDASGLTRFDGSDGVPAMNAVGAGRPGEFEVSPDGSLWITAQGGPAQSVLYRFDGSTWTRFRDGSGEIQIAPDGAVWYTGAGPEGLYVIPPTSSGG